jgi:hypothetical protein
MTLKEKFFFCIQIVETYRNRPDRELGVAQVKKRQDGQYASHHFTYDAIEFLERLKAENLELYEQFLKEYRNQP